VTPEQLAAKIRTIPDFPQPGIVFRDITTLLQDAEAFSASIDAMTAPLRGLKADALIGIESRGFIFGAPIARELGIGFVPVRKLGKLPGETISIEYDLEYGTNVLQIHRDALRPGARVIIVDDVLATGGTVAGTLKLVEQLGAIPVAISFLAELPALGGRARLPDGIVSALIAF
jgi:adenine phosphoribosyltransferase